MNKTLQIIIKILK